MKRERTDDFFWAKFVEVYQQSVSVLIKDPMIWIPFVFIGIIDLIALTLLFLAPSPPVSYVLAPIIRTFWSPRFLHYPVNFLLLPKLFTHVHFLIATFFGVFATGIAVKKIEGELKYGQRVKTIPTMGLVAKRYFSLVIGWLISYALFKMLFEILSPMIGLSLWLQLGIGLIAAVIVQAVLGFIIPAVMLSDDGFLKSVWRGLVFGFSNVAMVSALIFGAILVITLVSFVKGLAPVFVSHIPESVLWVLMVGIFFSVLADIWVTSVTTVLFVRKTGELNYENA